MVESGKREAAMLAALEQIARLAAEASYDPREALRVRNALAEVATKAIANAKAAADRTIPYYACEHGIPGGCRACAARERAEDREAAGLGEPEDTPSIEDRMPAEYFTERGGA